MQGKVAPSVSIQLADWLGEYVVLVDAAGCLSFSTTLQQNWQHRTKKGPDSLIHHAGTHSHTHPHTLLTLTLKETTTVSPCRKTWFTVVWIKRSNLDHWLIEIPIKIKKKPAFANCFTAHASVTNKSKKTNNLNTQNFTYTKNSSVQLYNKNPDFIKWTCVSVAVIPSMRLLHQEP